jgi:hypothetical protein
MPMHSESHPAAPIMEESGEATLPKTPVFPKACRENASGPVSFSLRHRPHQETTYRVVDHHNEGEEETVATSCSQQRVPPPCYDASTICGHEFFSFSH